LTQTAHQQVQAQLIATVPQIVIVLLQAIQLSIVLASIRITITTQAQAHPQTLIQIIT